MSLQLGPMSRLLHRFGTCLMVALICISCSDDNDSDLGKDPAVRSTDGASALGQHTLTVYKTPSCSCCQAWVDHVKHAGFGTDVVNQDTVAHIKDHFGVPAAARSCHTAISDSNYVFEGHVPAKYISEFLSAPVEGAKGLIVPAMPLGSPGMEVDDKFQPYTIYTLKENGGLAIFAEVSSYQQQF